ncbi:hypothetical protein E4U42_002717 [Claviceps africana]|uniref:Serine/arginine repetitive matrix protein 1 n=1 Tax=Claviceps africana TaxID=83212 RepID=A0A8K0NJD1_9HYPO|nr:hypothetical protein E4U42_002717 [Claviceps africana]
MERDRDARGRRYDDGEVVRYGAGESWRPTPRGGPPGDRSPRRPRSPIRDRLRSPIRERPRSPLRDRPRSPIRDRPRSLIRDRPRSLIRDRPRSPLRDRPRSPIRDRPRSPRARSPRPRSPLMPSSDSYVPGRYPPRRRSRSGGDRFLRRERSRERESPPRRRERTRSPPPMRRSPGPPRPSLSRRGSPIRDMRFERPRSPPRRDWERGREQERDRERDWDRDRMRDRDRGLDRRDDRRRSRSPYGRERRDRSPPIKSPLVAPRGASYRLRSRSLSRSRFGERYQPYRRATPVRETGVSSAVTSQPTSEKASPRPSPVKARSPLPSREQSPHRTIASGSGSIRGTPRSGPPEPASASRTPPRGPAALRGPPPPPAAAAAPSPAAAAPGPAVASAAAAAPGSRALSSAISSSPLPTINSAWHPSTPGRTDAPSPTNPPSGPRGYVPPSRGGYSHRMGGRPAWSQPSSRQMSGLSPSPTTPGGSGSIPTGPRGSQSAAGGSGGAGGSSTPTSARPFNPPTGPASQHGSGSGPRQTLAQSLLSTMPPLVPGGKVDASMTPLILGVTRDLEPHYRKLRDEEEKLRDDVRARQERLRKSLYMWDRLERESRAWELRSDLSEKSMKNLAGEGMGGAAF